MCRIASLVTEAEKETCQATRAISTTSRRELSSRSFFFFFYPLQGKAPKEIHAILIEILGEHATSYSTVKNWAEGRNFSSDAEVIAAAETWLHGQPSAFFF